MEDEPLGIGNLLLYLYFYEGVTFNDGGEDENALVGVPV